MRHTDVLISSAGKSWKQFSAAWEKVRARGSEKSVHDLRVSTRRLIAALELVRVVSRNEDIPRVQKRFKKVLKLMGPLRDVQVQLENLSEIQTPDAVKDFRRKLKRRECSEIEGIRKDLKPKTMRRLSDSIAGALAQFDHVPEGQDNAAVRKELDNFLGVRHREFWRERSRFRPSDEETLHKMRIALKKLRYVVEAAQRILGPWARPRVIQMKACQDLMGDTRDLQILKADLERWAEKEGSGVRKTLEPELVRLEHKRRSLMNTIKKSSADFEELMPQPESKPAREVTHLIPEKQVAAKIPNLP